MPEFLQAVSNVIELKPDKRYMFVFSGVSREAANHILSRLKAIGITAFALSLSEGESVQIIEYPKEAKSERVSE